MTIKNRARRYLNRALARFDLHLARRYSLPVHNRNELIRCLEVNRILDVGAHTGESVLELLALGWSGQADSFEPDARSFPELEQRASSHEWWSVHRIAIGDREATANLHLSKNEISSSLRAMTDAHLRAAPDSVNTGSVEVGMRRLDDAIAVETEDRIFLKIDVQGFESEVLAGASRVLSNVVLAQIELSFLPLYEGQSLWIDVVSTMSRHGFTLCEMLPGIHDPYRHILLQADGLFIRESELAKLPRP